MRFGSFEARFAGGELDHGLLPLLLFGDLFRLDLDAREFGEFLDVLLKIVAARTLGEDHLELGAGIFLPLRLGRVRREFAEAKRARCHRASQNCTARNTMIFHCFLPEIGFLLAAILASAGFPATALLHGGRSEF